MVSDREGAPDFTLHADDGKEVSLSDYRGRIVVLYFYPKDGTPGCTREAIEFRRAHIFKIQSTISSSCMYIIVSSLNTLIIYFSMSVNLSNSPARATFGRTFDIVTFKGRRSFRRFTFISNNTVIIIGCKLRPPCELVVRSVLPAFRSLVAKSLVEKYHFSQVAAAEKLGTTQASISHYLYSKRGDKRVTQLEASPSVRAIVDEIAEGIATEELSSFDAMLQFCKLCKVLRTGDLICDWHRDFLTVPEACDVCPPIKG